MHGAQPPIGLWQGHVLVGWRAVRVIRSNALSRAPAFAALQLVVALTLLALTDNVLTATLQFAAPAAVIFAWSDRIHFEGMRDVGSGNVLDS